MAIEAELRDQLAGRFEVLLPHLNERQQRLALATEARLLGYGGIRAVAEATGVSATTVRKGVAELESGEDSLPVGRARRAGGGRKRASEHDPELTAALLGLVEPDERGDPMSPLRWTTKSLRHLAEQLARQGHPVSAPTVGRLLRENGFSLQGTAKTLEGAQHPDRDAQFHYINEQVKAHQDAGAPVISVDAKKKEQLGQLPSAGREWRPKGDPVKVEDHSFFTAGPDGPVAVPYGVYDLSTDSGWVNVGVDHDTSAFAVASIRRWWQARGASDYPGANRLLITADAGGSNSYRYRLWKAELATFAAETGLTITVCHFPPGTSKWNKIEHRLFSQITMNWRGRPLTSHEVVVATIAATRTRTGLRVHAELDAGAYPLGVAVTREQLRSLPSQAHAQHGQWNYTIAPTGGQVAPVGAQERTRARTAALRLLADQRLTGMNRDELAALTQALAPAQKAQAAQRCFEQRGGQRRRAPGAGSTGLLSAADRVLVTVVYLRQICSQNVLSDLLGINANSIGQAIAETRQLLNEHHRTIPATTLRFTTASALVEFVSSDRPQPPRSRVSDRLANPTLTGLSRPELAAMTKRVRHVQDARNERHRHRRRGTERLPGARGGVFTQKSPTLSGSSRQCSTSASCAPKTPSPNCSRSAGAPLATSSAKSARSWPKTDSAPPPPAPTSPPQLTSSPPFPTTRTPRHRQVDSLQLHKIGNVLAALPKSAQPGAKRALAEVYHAENKDLAVKAAKAFEADYGAKWPKATAKVIDDLDVLLAFYDYPAEHWIHLRTTNPLESTFATVRLRQRVTKGPGSRAAGVAMAFKLIDSAQARWRAVNAPHLVALVRAGARFDNGKLVERPDGSGGDAQAA